MGVAPRAGTSPGFAGDEERAELYNDFRPLFNRLISQYGDTPEQREDLQGEIYCIFRRLLDEFDPDRGIPLRAYLVRQISVSVYTYARKQWRRRGTESSLEEICESGTVPRRLIQHDNLNEDVMQRIIAGDLSEAMSCLTERQRQVIVWRFYESLSFNDIAERLHVAPATARSLQRYGLENLRRYFLRKYGPLD